MDIEKKDLKEVKKNFDKIPRITWIYFDVPDTDTIKKAWFIKCDDDKTPSYVLVRYPNGPFKKLMIEDGGIYITKKVYRKLFTKVKTSVKKPKKKNVRRTRSKKQITFVAKSKTKNKKNPRLRRINVDSGR